MLKNKFLLLKILLIVTGSEIYSMHSNDSDHARIVQNFDTHIMNRQYDRAMIDLTSLTAFEMKHRIFRVAETYGLNVWHTLDVYYFEEDRTQQDKDKISIIQNYVKQRTHIEESQEDESIIMELDFKKKFEQLKAIKESTQYHKKAQTSEPFEEFEKTRTSGSSCHLQ